MAKGAHEPCASDRVRCILRDEARSTAPAALPPVRPAEPVRAGVQPAGPKLLVHGPAPGPLRPYRVARRAASPGMHLCCLRLLGRSARAGADMICAFVLRSTSSQYTTSRWWT